MKLVRRGPATLALAAAPLLAGLVVWGCLREETVEYAPTQCYCSGAECLGGRVSRLSPSSDEEAGDCSGCHLTELGICLDGCKSVEVIQDVPGCPVAYACNSWDRVEPGASCENRFDCEPGSVDGQPVNTLDCVQGRCVDVGARKWDEVSLEPQRCSGKPWFGAHPLCNGGGCLSPQQYGRDYYCSVARCIADSDCPEGWFCRCQEEKTYEGLLRAWRWCVPSNVPDAGEVLPDAGLPPEGDDAGTAEPDAGEDAGLPDEG